MRVYNIYFSFLSVAPIEKCIFSLAETSSSRGAEESGEKKCMKTAGSNKNDLFVVQQFFGCGR